MSRAASTVTTIERSGSVSPVSGSQKSSRAPSFLASIGILSPPKQASAASMTGIPFPDDPSASPGAPRDRTSSAQIPRRSNSAKMLIARARSKSSNLTSNSASAVGGSSPQSISGVSTPLRQSNTRANHTSDGASPSSTNGRRRSSGASDKRISNGSIKSPGGGESSPRNVQSPPRDVAINSHDSVVVGSATGIGVRPASKDHVRQSFPIMNVSDQAGTVEQQTAGKVPRPVASVPAIVTTSSPSINERTEKRKTSSGSLSALGPSIRITTTVTEEGGKESIEVIDLEEADEDNLQEEDVWRQGKDRYYDPDEEDEIGDSPGPPVRTFVPLRDVNQQQVDTSSTSIKAGGSRNKLGSTTRLGSRNGLNGPVTAPSADVAAHMDPLASARNLFLGSNDGPVAAAPRADDGGAGADYLQYLLTRKFSSTNFISRIESKDVVWDTGQPTAKFVGPFLLGQVIGKGSFGKVKDGMCSETLQPVAIKILAHKRLRKIQFGIEAVTKEIQTLRRLRGHPNVVRLLEVYAKAEDPDGNIDVLPWSQYLETEMNYKTLKRYMVFEFCHGNLQSLLDSTPDGTIPLHQAQDYTIQLTEGLMYLHARHVVHRDIKPANLLLTLDGVLKISDFGVAEVLTPYDGTDLCQNYAGTQQYMSPEVAAGEMNPSGEKVDVWASGVTVYNMAFGTFPFDFSNAAMGMFESIQASTLDIPDGTNPDLASFLQGVLEKSPTNRFTLTQMHKHPFLCTEASALAEGPYVPLPTLTADAAAAHAAVTLGRGKGTLARPVSPRTLSRRPATPEPEEDPHSDQESKLPYSLFPALEPLFPELANLNPLPDAVQKAAEENSKSRRSSLGKRKSIVAAFGGAPSTPAAGGGGGFFARNFGRKGSGGGGGTGKRFGFSVG
ncbi:kinase-like domain-containing protein [Catenaria anguillulae PL171]|uniref:Kinase-like domain-containing protein n=1 Tax=Catenaria anguillulae PL171 TaxID=765915 RepID=A0A1Y2HVS4_9FUNG|nr:kinase-like domain-containing protein [Catenaria anguillulae PL171]